MFAGGCFAVPVHNCTGLPPVSSQKLPVLDMRHHRHIINHRICEGFSPGLSVPRGAESVIESPVGAAARGKCHSGGA